MAQDYTELNQAISDSPGASLDKELLEELKANYQDLSGQLGQSGEDVFSASGTPITINDLGVGTAYHVFITALGAPMGNIGDITVIRDSATQFTVYRSGSSLAGFCWLAKK